MVDCRVCHNAFDRQDLNCSNSSLVFKGSPLYVNSSLNKSSGRCRVFYSCHGGQACKRPSTFLAVEPTRTPTLLI